MDERIINKFVKAYNDELDIYEKVKRDIHKQLETKLNDSGVMALVTSRVKDTGRLKEKLVSRNKKKKYTNEEDVYSDIVDLIGLRIALYFPNDISRVESLIKNEFTVTEIKSFPDDRKANDIYIYRFEGYSAKHYRVTYLYKERIYKVEIQVASLLMHAWAEVEHDLAYKQKKGAVSFDEYEALDEINGLVIAGEISLQRLQRISELRMASEKEAFSNHYQLADYIYKSAENNTLNAEIIVGDVETLFKMLQQNGRLTKRKVDNELHKVDYKSNMSIAEQIMDIYANKNSKSSIELMKIKVNKDPLREDVLNEKLIGRFLTEWIKLEKLLVDLSRQFKCDVQCRNYNIVSFLEKYGLSPNIIGEYQHLRKTRNVIVHGVEIPEDDMIEGLVEEISLIRKQIKKHFETIQEG